MKAKPYQNKGRIHHLMSDERPTKYSEVEEYVDSADDRYPDKKRQRYISVRVDNLLGNPRQERPGRGSKMFVW